MCWATPIVLKKPLRVCKITTLGIFISQYQNFRYYKFQIMPTVKINPKFERSNYFAIGYFGELWKYDRFYGYHSYLTEKRAKSSMYSSGKIGIFEIPVGATVYRHREVVSTDIKYLGLLKE